MAQYFGSTQVRMNIIISINQSIIVFLNARHLRALVFKIKLFLIDKSIFIYFKAKIIVAPISLQFILFYTFTS